MKKSILAAVLAASILLVGCGTQKPTSEEAKGAIQQVLSAIDKNDAESFKKLLTKSNADEMEKANSKSIKVPGLTFEIMPTPVKISEDGNSAEVSVMSNLSGFKQETNWILRNEGGKWKFDTGSAKL